jgi:hypothetical protein
MRKHQQHLSGLSWAASDALVSWDKAAVHHGQPRLASQRHQSNRNAGMENKKSEKRSLGLLH